MSLLLIEGFDSFGTSGVPSGISRKYTTGGAASMALQTGYDSGTGLELGSTGENLTIGNIGTPQTCFIGFYFKISALSGAESIVFFRESGSNNIVLRINADGSFSILRSTTVLGTTAASLISTDTWYHIEIKAKIDNTAGEYDLRVDGVSKLSGTSVDTQQGTNAWTDGFIIRGKSFANIIYDHLYILDTAGSANNTFLGPSIVKAIYPNAAGDASDFTPDTGSNHERVDENPTDDDTSYVESSTTGHKDLHNYGNITGSLGAIAGVQINTEVRDTVAGGSSLKSLAKSGTTTDTGSADTIGGTSYEYDTRILEQDPDTSAAWTKSGVDGAQFGYEVG